MSNKDRFPLIWEVTLSMAQSAGMINREEPDAVQRIEKVMDEALGAEGVYLDDLCTP